jgi:hypothetical protein
VPRFGFRVGDRAGRAPFDEFVQFHEVDVRRIESACKRSSERDRRETKEELLTAVGIGVISRGGEDPAGR